MNLYNQISDALTYISPDLPREEWVKVCMAIKSALPNEFSLFDDWSKGGQSYNPRDALATWKSVRPVGGLTIATLFYMASQNGFIPNLKVEQIDSLRIQPTNHESPVGGNEEYSLIQDTALRSNIVWSQAIPANESHPYLAKKCVSPVSIGEIGPDCIYLPKILKGPGRYLVIPLHDHEGNIWSVQFISEDGKKAFIAGKQMPGSFFRIGYETKTFAIVESAITGLSYFHSTRETTICALSAGALMKVAKGLRGRYPNPPIKIIADDDWAKPNNTGLESALKAASVIGANVYRPNFEGLPRTPEDTDFNDLCILRGVHGSN